MSPISDDLFFNLMTNVFPILFTIVFILVFGTILFSIFRGLKSWKYNNAQPELSVIAKIVSKRSDTSGSIHNINNGTAHHGHTYTTYYVTFEVESGDRMEFRVADKDYGLLAEGDIGKLKFQGTRYLGFIRGK